MANAKDILKKYWWVIALVVILAFAVWVRTGAMKYTDLPDIDTYYWLRVDGAMVNNSFKIPAIDTLRNWPYGVPNSPPNWADLPMNYYLPPAMYVLLNPLLNMSFYRFEFVEPVILAAIGVVIIFLLANELFGDKKKAILTTFFFAVLPAAITRLSAGEMDKEANSVVFMLLTLLFFVKSYKAPNWKWKGLAYGVISGISMGIMGITWGGIQFIYVIFSLFAFLLLLMNKPKGLWHSFIPTVLIGIIFQVTITPMQNQITSYEFLIAMAVCAMVVIRELAGRFKVIKQESLKLVSPGIAVIAIVGVLAASMFSDFVSNMLNNLWSMATLYQATLTTVAESIPGDWNAVVGQTGLAFSSIPQLSGISILLSAWLLMLLGVLAMFYTMIKSDRWGKDFKWFVILCFVVILAAAFRLFSASDIYFGAPSYLWGLFTFIIGLAAVLIITEIRHRGTISSINKPELVLPVVFLLFSIYATFFGIRLAYFLGFSGSLMAGYFCGWFVDFARKVKTTSSIKTTSLIYLILAGFFGAAFVLTLSTPLLALPLLFIAVCLAIPGYAMRVESQESWIRKAWLKLRGIDEVRLDLIMIPVVIFIVLLAVVNASNAYTYGNQLGPTINPYFNDAMKYLREQTPQNTSVLSWWDFGYWFQAVGQRATVVDGSGVGNTSRYDVAIWFTDDAKNWSQWLPWLNNKLDVGYILMDYTMPGKYGAISKIASHETTVVGIVQFDQVGTTQQGNTTIQEFGVGQYQIWVPISSSGGIAGTPVFLATDGTQYQKIGYINDFCTTSGILSVGNESQAVGGCITTTPYGFFYVPAAAEHTIFTSLMFMDGYGLTGLKKVFDNGLIHIYDMNSTAH